MISVASFPCSIQIFRFLKPLCNSLSENPALKKLFERLDSGMTYLSVKSIWPWYHHSLGSPHRSFLKHSWISLSVYYAGKTRATILVSKQVSWRDSPIGVTHTDGNSTWQNSPNLATSVRCLRAASNAHSSYKLAVDRVLLQTHLSALVGHLRQALSHQVNRTCNV